MFDEKHVRTLTPHRHLQNTFFSSSVRLHLVGVGNTFHSVFLDGAVVTLFRFFVGPYMPLVHPLSYLVCPIKCRQCFRIHPLQHA
jgi:hypothetical protein